MLHECSCFIEFIKRVKETIQCETCRAFYHLFGTRLINLIKQDSTNVIFYLSHDLNLLKILKNRIFGVKTSILILPSLTQR